MNGKSLVAFLAGAAVAATTVSVLAHHSFAAEFDADKPVAVKGVITSVRLENPHSWFFLDVAGADGKVEKWAFEASTPSSLIRSGFKPGHRQGRRRGDDPRLPRARSEGKRGRRPRARHGRRT